MFVLVSAARTAQQMPNINNMRLPPISSNCAFSDRLNFASSCPAVSNCAHTAVQPKSKQGLSQVFFTNTLPGSCRINRFISNPSSATETAEAGKPLRRMRSSMATSSLSTKS